MGDAEFAQRVATKFHNEYEKYASADFPPKEIFRRLYNLTVGAGKGRGSPQAIAAVLAYFFERCDIFKNSPNAPELAQSVGSVI